MSKTGDLLCHVDDDVLDGFFWLRWQASARIIVDVIPRLELLLVNFVFGFHLLDVVEKFIGARFDSLDVSEKLVFRGDSLMIPPFLP